MLANNNGVPVPPSGASLQPSLPPQQFLTQHNAAYAAAAAQQSGQYVINTGQDPAPYMGLIPAGVPQYYNMGPWGVYPAGLIQQQGSQPRRPLTPSQQGAEQAYQVSRFIGLLYIRWTYIM